MMPPSQVARLGALPAWPRVIVTGNDQRREYELGAINTIGRHPDNTLQILDRIVSKEHAQIIRQPDGRFLFRDLGSLNGSFLRGERVSEHMLDDGDEIMLGSTTLMFQERSPRGLAAAEGHDRALGHRGPDPPEDPGRRPPRASSCPRSEIFDVEVLRRDYEKLRLAHELGRSIGLEVNLDVLLEKIIMKAFELIPADRGVILLMEDGVPSRRSPRPATARTSRSSCRSRS